MARNRNTANKGLPPNLYLRNGYYSYRDPRTRKEYGLGRNRTLAITEAIQANIEIFGHGESLVNKINSKAVITVGVWCEKYDVLIQQRGLSAVTLVNKRHLIKSIPDHIREMPISTVSVKDIADLLSEYINKGAASMAKVLRAELRDLFREAMADGLIMTNPVEGTRNPRTCVSRSRLSIDDFRAILSVAEQTKPAWFTHIMKAALVTGQRQGDLCRMHRNNIDNGRLYVEQKKTGAKLSIPLDLEIAGIKLRDITDKCGNDYLFSSTPGKTQSEQMVRKYFLSAREATGLTWNGTPPPFHEIRSLAARLYTEERSTEFAKQLLGHKSVTMTAIYQDTRGGRTDIVL
ncbi:tyrosine-type recombinase/integrase [Morganella morganii]|uniref:tyrosine-type recombinase/integrase n=1 Tax=Morganella morganii TaxID=582 RepID=UPI003138D59A